MKLASKRLRAVGRVVGRTAANHTSTRLRQQEKRNQEGKVTLARIGRLKTRKRTFLDKPTVARQPALAQVRQVRQVRVHALEPARPLAQVPRAQLGRQRGR